MVEGPRDQSCFLFWFRESASHINQNCVQYRILPFVHFDINMNNVVPKSAVLQVVVLPASSSSTTTFLVHAKKKHVITCRYSVEKYEIWNTPQEAT